MGLFKSNTIRLAFAFDYIVLRHENFLSVTSNTLILLKIVSGIFFSVNIEFQIFFIQKVSINSYPQISFLYKYNVI